MSNNGTLQVKHLGTQPYDKTWRAMHDYTDRRGPDTPDQLWLLEHPPVFTLGQAGKPEHLLDPGSIPVVKTDRGGQVTYHGPGQLVAYLLLDLRRAGLGVRGLVSLLEQSVIRLLADLGIEAVARRDAPGVYVNDAKIAAIGLRVRRGCSFHGLSLNLDMDLSPFDRINPCGYPGLRVTQLSELITKVDLPSVQQDLTRYLAQALSYTLELDPETQTKADSP